MSKLLTITHTGHAGTITWTLPPEASRVLLAQSPAVCAKLTEALGTNLHALASAILKAFGDPIRVEVLNMIMREIQEVADKK